MQAPVLRSEMTLGLATLVTLVGDCDQYLGPGPSLFLASSATLKSQLNTHSSSTTQNILIVIKSGLIIFTTSIFENEISQIIIM